MEMQRKWNEEHREQEKFLKENSNKLNKALCELIKKENNNECVLIEHAEKSNNQKNLIKITYNPNSKILNQSNTEC